MPDQPRPIWPTRAMRDAIDQAAMHFEDEAVDWAETEYAETAADLRALVAAWDAAPADPTEAADDAIAGAYQADELLYGQHVRHMASAVLRALGMPDA